MMIADIGSWTRANVVEHSLPIWGDLGMFLTSREFVVLEKDKQVRFHAPSLIWAH